MAGAACDLHQSLYTTLDSLPCLATTSRLMLHSDCVRVAIVSIVAIVSLRRYDRGGMNNINIYEVHIDL